MLKGILLSLRPRQWIKNFIIFAALLFGGKYMEAGALARTGLVFVFFCLLAGGGYLVNDVSDIEKDRLHPQKKGRPVAAGLVPKGAALASGLALMAIGVLGCFLLDPLTGLVGGCYLVLGLLYTSWLKKVVLLDVLAIAAAFVLRAIAGATAIKDRKSVV